MMLVSTQVVKVRSEDWEEEVIISTLKWCKLAKNGIELKRYVRSVLQDQEGGVCCSD